ncbi:DUF6702 family protein [Polaribacter sp. HaHaR_3_91]|uniref:DUF6702 family protein n=1 Tax=Polaribacter sp. HaHaR_3_91 TaxID=2745561 RepID=UPI001C4F32CC|nr:DUF6702 family protein [Polaribacter sp. HaHaR_3_91]QXP64798.1 hypothetical protein H0I27_06385 [Polaribacter sp. HaHaR_3_91]
MRILIITFLFFLNFGNTNDFHDAVSATFNVVERGHVLMLEIDFDTFNFLKLDASKSIKVTKDDFSAYLNKTSSWKFDGEKITPQVLTIKSENHHTKVICFLAKSRKNIKKVEIKNEFLLNVETHSNIVELDINETFKDFRMYKDRKEIVVNYN